MKILLTLCCAALAATASAQGPEALSRQALTSFSSLAGWRFLPTQASPSILGAPAAMRKAKRVVRLSGPVRFHGATYANAGTYSVYVGLSGNLELSGDGGRLTSGYTSVSHSDFFTLSGTFVSGWTRPNVYVSLYRDGRYLGGAWASGMVYVTGTYVNGWVNLSGDGTLEADIQVEE